MFLFVELDRMRVWHKLDSLKWVERLSWVNPWRRCLLVVLVDQPEAQLVLRLNELGLSHQGCLCGDEQVRVRDVVEVATEIPDVHYFFKAVNKGEGLLLNHLLVLKFAELLLGFVLELVAGDEFLDNSVDFFPPFFLPNWVTLFKATLPYFIAVAVLSGSLGDEGLHDVEELGEGALTVHVLHVVLDGGIREDSAVVDVVLVVAEANGVSTAILQLHLLLASKFGLGQDVPAERPGSASTFESPVFEVDLLLLVVENKWLCFAAAFPNMFRCFDDFHVFVLEVLDHLFLRFELYLDHSFEEFLKLLLRNTSVVRRALIVELHFSPQVMLN